MFRFHFSTFQEPSRLRGPSHDQLWPKENAKKGTSLGMLYGAPPPPTPRVQPAPDMSSLKKLADFPVPDFPVHGFS
jgi:hypothetical protein